MAPKCDQVEKFQTRKLGTEAVSNSAVFGVQTMPQSVTFPSHAVYKPACLKETERETGEHSLNDTFKYIYKSRLYFLRINCYLGKIPDGRASQRRGVLNQHDFALVLREVDFLAV